MPFSIIVTSFDLTPSSSTYTGTGQIFLGDNLKMENLIISGNYEITVSDNLSILIIDLFFQNLILIS